MKNTPAFPRTGYIDTSSGTLPDGDEVIRHTEGMTLLDYFAAKAMQSLILAEYFSGSEEQHLEQAYRYADAALQVREKKSI